MKRDLRTIRLMLASAAMFAAAPGTARAQPAGAVAPAEVAQARSPEMMDLVLANGMRLIVRAHGDAVGGRTGQTAFWLRVEAGSGHEMEDERGAAHVAEHLALSGPERGQPGFGAAGWLDVPIGKNRNAYTNVDHSAYWVVTDGSPEQNDAAMRTLATVLRPLTISQAMLDRERDVVVEEWDASDSPEARAQRTLLSGLFPGTALDTRWPSVEPDVLARLTPASVKRFLDRTTTPDRATLIVVGPSDPRQTVKLATGQFGGLARGPVAVGDGAEPAGALRASPERQDRRRGLRTVRAQAEGLTETEITIAWPGQVSPNPLRVQALTESIAVNVLRDRFRRLVAKTRDWAGSDLVVLDTALPVSVGEGGDREALRLTQMGASFPPASASRGLSTMALVVAGIEHNPVTAQELEASVSSALLWYERAAKAEASSPPLDIASRMASGIRSQGTTTAAGRLAWAREALREIGPARVTDTARALFDPRQAVLLAQGAPGTLPPSSAMMADLRLALFAAPGVDGEPAIGDAGQEPDLFVRPPTPIRVQRVSLDEGTGVFDAVLANGVTVRHREMPVTDGDVYLRVIIGQGAMPQSEWEKAQAAAEILSQRPATRASPGDDLARMLERWGLDLDASTTDGPIQLLVRGPADSLSRGLDLLAAMLTEPHLDSVDVERFRARSVAQHEQTRADPARLAKAWIEWELSAAADTTVPRGQEPAAFTLDSAAYTGRLEAYTTQGLAAALREATRRGQVVVSVVGACARDAAIDAAAAGFSALPSSEARPEPAGLGRPADGRDARVTATSPTGTVASATAWSLRREIDTQELRGLVVATTIVNERLEEIEGLGEFMREYARATVAFDRADPGQAAVVVMFTAEPEQIEPLRRRVDGVLRGFAAQGPTAEEMDRARQRGVSISERALGSAWFWSSRLVTIELAGRSLDEVVTMPTDYASVSAEACRLLIGEALVGGRVSVVASSPER